MPIAWKSMPLDEPQELLFPDGQEIIVDCRDTDFDHLGVRFSFGLDRVLPGAVDADESLRWPRVTILTGNDPREMFFFGGPIAYRLRSDGEIVQRVETRRNLAEYECGSLDVLRHQNMAVIVYEVGILAIDDDLRPRWLKRKYMGSYEIAIENDLLKLRQRFMRPVIHRLSDGELISSPSDYSPGVGGRALPNHREMIESFLGALDAEGPSERSLQSLPNWLDQPIPEVLVTGRIPAPGSSPHRSRPFERRDPQMASTMSSSTASCADGWSAAGTSKRCRGY